MLNNLEELQKQLIDINIGDEELESNLTNILEDINSTITLLKESSKEDLNQTIEDISSKLETIRDNIINFKEGIQNSSLENRDEIVEVLLNAILIIEESQDIAVICQNAICQKPIEMIEIKLKKGRNTISGDIIDLKHLSNKIHSLWVIKDDNWYGYSPDANVTKEIEESYALIDFPIKSYKGVLIYTYEDTTIKVAKEAEELNVEHKYKNGISLHGTDGKELDISTIRCEEPNKLRAVIKIEGEKISIYNPSIPIEGMEDFTTLYKNDGYIVICDDK